MISVNVGVNITQSVAEREMELFLLLSVFGRNEQDVL